MSQKEYPIGTFRIVCHDFQEFHVEIFTGVEWQWYYENNKGPAIWFRKQSDCEKWILERYESEKFLSDRQKFKKSFIADHPPKVIPKP